MRRGGGKISPGYEHGLSYAERSYMNQQWKGAGGDNIIYTHAVTNYISTYVYIRDFGGKTMLPQRKTTIIRLLKDCWFVLRRCFSCKCHAALHEKLRIITNSELRSWRRHGVRYFTIMFFVVKIWILATMEDLFPIIQNSGSECRPGKNDIVIVWKSYWNNCVWFKSFLSK